MSLLVLKLGTGILPEGIFTAYALMNGTALFDMYVASNDDEALQKAAESAHGHALECEPGLTEAAQRRGYPVRPLTAGEAADRAHCSLSVFAQDTFEGINQPEVLLDFFEAAYVFAYAVQTDTRQWSFIADIRGTVADTTLHERLGVLVNTGVKPSLYAMTEEVHDRLHAGSCKLDDIDCLAVVFEDEPRAVAETLEQPYGLTSVPTPYMLWAKHRWVPDAVIVEKLAGLMGVIGRHISAGHVGMAWNPRLGGLLEIRLGVRGIAD